MKDQTLQVTVRSSATPDDVWRLLAAIDTWSRWGPWSSAALDSPGAGEPDGVGAVRRLRYRRTVSVEEVTAFEPPHRLGYRLLAGLPVRDYRSEVRLDAAPEGGTRITWSSRFHGLAPGQGAVMAWILGRFMARVATALASAASRP
jgi:uncharacterized protein YndB with AHSA1/START domain